MKTITSSISGLASSLCLNIGLTQIAQKLDPVTRSKPQTMKQAISAEFSEPPTQFTPEKGQ